MARGRLACLGRSEETIDWQEGGSSLGGFSLSGFG